MTALDRYARLVEFCRSGGRLPRPVVDEILKAAGKNDRDLVGALLVGPGRETVLPGDACRCGGRVYVATSRRRDAWQQQYLACDTCGEKLGFRLVPSGTIRRRRRKCSN